MEKQEGKYYFICDACGMFIPEEDGVFLGTDHICQDCLYLEVHQD